MIRIIDQASVLVEENRLSRFKRNAMLGKVGSGLSPIPGKFNIAHSIILAISNVA